MYFISILIVLAVLHYRRAWLRKLQNDRWFLALCQRSHSLSPLAAFIVCIVLPCVLFAALLYASRFTWPLVNIALSTLALMYALGRGRYLSLYDDYQKAWQLDNKEQIQQNIAIVLAQLDATIALPESLTEQHILARRLFIYHAFSRLFVVLFWFALLGPVAALFYRLNKLYPNKQNAFVATAKRYIEWPCARLFVFSLALLGNFPAVKGTLKAHFFNQHMSNKDFIYQGALLALNQDMQWQTSRFIVENDQQSIRQQAIDEVAAIQQMMRQCVILALVFIALLNVFT